jgi:hypothetical protein
MHAYSWLLGDGEGWEWEAEGEGDRYTGEVERGERRIL